MTRRTRLLALLLLVPLLAVVQLSPQTSSAAPSAVITPLEVRSAPAAKAARATRATPAARERMCANGGPQRVVRDPSGDSARGIDITHLGLWHKRADRCVWTTITGHFGASYAQVIQVLYDTNLRRPGADYYAFAYSPRDGDERRGTSFVGRVGREWRRLGCDVYYFFRPAKSQIALGLPKACLGNPQSVRVKVQLWDIRDYRRGNTWGGVADQVPNRQWTRGF